MKRPLTSFCLFGQLWEILYEPPCRYVGQPFGHLDQTNNHATIIIQIDKNNHPIVKKQARNSDHLIIT